MDKTYAEFKTNERRLRENFESLARIGQSPDDGVDRPAFSSAHLDARRWFSDAARRAGLAVRKDGAGNRICRLSSPNEEAQILLMGSHLDSVPNGGRYDGALGVLCALEVLMTLQDEKIPLPFHLEAADFTDEEGAFVGMLGSRALSGDMSSEHLAENAGADDVFGDMLERDDLTREGLFSAAYPADALAGYLEVHVEQGPRLVEKGIDIGIVTNITGIIRYQLKFKGESNHAGTTPMGNRRDASRGAVEFARSAWDVVVRNFPDSVVTVGAMQFEPGVFNVIPGAVTLSLEFRSPEEAGLKALEARLTDEAKACADRFGLGIEIECVERCRPVPLSPQMQHVIEKAAGRLNRSYMKMSSGAGHDAQSFAAVCPTGMIFIPSVNGISHCPQEFTKWEDCVNGADVLLHAVLELSRTLA